VPIVLKSGSLNLLELSGPVQACKGIALPRDKNRKWAVICIEIKIESGQSFVNHVAVDELADCHMNRQQFVFVTVTVPMFFPLIVCAD
jgi:hypothetical protein